MADVKLVPDPPPPPRSTICDPLPEELPRPPASPPDTVAAFTIECTPRDARRACNELSTAIDYFRECATVAEHGSDRDRYRARVESMLRLGEQLDKIARAGGLAVGEWTEVHHD